MKKIMEREEMYGDFQKKKINFVGVHTAMSTYPVYYRNLQIIHEIMYTIRQITFFLENG